MRSNDGHCRTGWSFSAVFGGRADSRTSAMPRKQTSIEPFGSEAMGRNRTWTGALAASNRSYDVVSASCRATLRAQSMKRSAVGLSVRVFSLTIPVVRGRIGRSMGSRFRPSLFPLSHRVDSERTSTNRPVARSAVASGHARSAGRRCFVSPPAWLKYILHYDMS
jgi:hypothetical protein